MAATTTTNLKRKAPDEAPEVINVGTTARSLAAALRKENGKAAAAASEQPDASELTGPSFDISTLPPEAIHRYLLFHKLIPSNPVALKEALFPCPTITSDTDSDAMEIVEAKSARLHASTKQMSRKTLNSSLGGPSKRAKTNEPPQPAAAELCNLTAFDDADGVLSERLHTTAKDHWQQETAAVRETEILGTFMYLCRTRGKVLRSQPSFR